MTKLVSESHFLLNNSQSGFYISIYKTNFYIFGIKGIFIEKN